MEGKKITKVMDLGSSYSLLQLDNDELAIVKIVNADLTVEEVIDFLGVPGDVKKDKTKKEPKSDDESYTWEELKALDREELDELADEVDVDSTDFEEDEDDELRLAIAKEADIEVPEDSSDTGSTSNDDDTNDDDYTWDDLKEMDYEELSELCSDNDTTVDPTDFDEDDEGSFRKAIAKEFDIAVPVEKKKKKKKK